MAFSDRISRSPLIYDETVAADIRAEFGDVPEPLCALLEAAASCSGYLAGLMRREAEWVRTFATHEADALRDGVWADIAAAEDLKPAFRQAKRRIALLTALADLGGLWPLETVTHCLTELADRCLQVGLSALVAAQIARGALPGLKPEDAETGGGMCVLAMGKMGAYELNYSSDIDLICLFDESRFAPDDYTQARATFVKITRALMGMMSDVTADGYVFRTDLRLRPDASVTPVCIAMEAAERYYESVGRTWERAAFIKARPCAGDIAAGDAFLQRLAPFIWRKHLDFAAIQDAHDMRLRIRSHKGLGGEMALEGHNMKLGAGGIREIEFFTQTRQLIAGGRDASLRARGTLEGLSCLVDAGWIPAEAAQVLAASYVAHREVEHRLQMIGDAQTHDLPKNSQGFDRLARFMGFAETESFRARVLERLDQVAAVTDEFFAPEADETGGDVPSELESAQSYLERWRSLPALRSERAVTLFQRVFPGVLAQMARAPRPREAMAEFERFLSGLPAGVQVFSLFDANPKLAALIVEICATSPALATYLSRNAAVLDAVIGGGFFAPWPGVDALRAELAEQMRQAPDYEAKLDTARRWQKEWHFRIGVHHLQQLLEAGDVAAQYADLAEATVSALMAVVTDEFARKHGPPPGQGALVLAMGSLGVGRLSAVSDLDMIVIYEPGDEEISTGPRSLPVRSYYAKLTQALVTALSAPMAEGRLYEVDLRLRPSGQSGPVATSLASYAGYQKGEAWVWEHLALTRARPVFGAAELRARVEEVRVDVLTDGYPIEQIKRETQEMRVRLAEAGRGRGTWDVKGGPGGMQDVELCSQAIGLMARSAARGLTEQLDTGVDAGLITTEDAATLAQAHDLYSRVQLAARLLTAKPLDPDEIGEGGLRLLLRECGCDSLDALAARLENCRKQAAGVVDKALS
ncbi:glutamate-ammonia-ligase adenylyltransferase [Litoreibacter ponti]|uniref:Glutamate-ammonia-ligase adenylyltransferase n=1 Tax=Litoreibacter ponti TaxID=1510457 RepID=A0A2T6BIL0_9RHOB|nr:glutamine-synthetase adenylyltransferase [Litoreibacter ponti]PTX55895.1 glutamate-ammonia-ligase adenylyltransferase [Litoreibacter ponti]